jgi:uncharacterized membrane-anchored protein
MNEKIEFKLEQELKKALTDLKTSGKKVELELQGRIENGELKIIQMDSYVDGPKSAPHCWHALTENTKDE